jgi:hypothetical protein
VPEGLLAPRLYRAAFAPALLALIVLAFSLQDPARPIAPEIAPPGFSGVRAQVFADQAVRNYGARESGSQQDSQLADLVQARLEAVGFRVSKPGFETTTLNGDRRLVNVVGVRPGPSDRRLLVVASRDGSRGPLARSGALETGVLVELARVLEGRAFDHTLVLASVSGGVDGGLGAARLAGELRGPIDAVIVLRNVGGAVRSAPVLATADSRETPDERFLRTLRRVAALEIGGGAYGTRVGAQLIRLGFPVALGEQATLPGQGLTGAAISPAGEPLRPPETSAAGPAGAAGRTALRSLVTFDGSFRPAAPAAAPLRVGGKLIPQWALVLLIGTLLFPLIVAAIDAWARARRRQQVSQRGVLAPAIAGAWLLVLGLLLRGAGLSGAIDAPALAPDPSAVTGAGTTVVAVFVLLLALFGVLVAAAAARQATPRGGEAGFALWLVFSGLAVFVLNPIAAGFLLLVLHLLVLMLLTGGAGRTKVLALAFVGLLPLIAVPLHFVTVFGIAVGGILRYGVMLEAGGFIGPLTLVAWCALAAAIGTSLINLLWSAPRPSGGASRSPAPKSF